MREEEHSKGGLSWGASLGAPTERAEAPGAGGHAQHQQPGGTWLAAPSLIQVVYPCTDRAGEEAGHGSSTSSARSSFPSALHLLCN